MVVLSLLPPPAVPVWPFDRHGGQNVIQCNTQDGILVTKEVVQDFFQKALEKKGLTCDMWSIADLTLI